jgi:hypothetical protein
MATHDGSLEPLITDGYRFDMYERVNTFWTCNTCGTGIVMEVEASPFPGPGSAGMTGFLNDCRKLKVHPANGYTMVPPETPEEIAGTFTRGVHLYRHNDFECSALKMRRVLEKFIELEKEKAENDVRKIIARMVDDGRVPRCLADWANKFRQLESDALHGFITVTPEEAGEFVVFTELFLTCIYAVPAILARRGKASSSSSEPGAS